MKNIDIVDTLAQAACNAYNKDNGLVWKCSPMAAKYWRGIAQKQLAALRRQGLRITTKE